MHSAAKYPIFRFHIFDNFHIALLAVVPSLYDEFRGSCSLYRILAVKVSVSVMLTSSKLVSKGKLPSDRVLARGSMSAAVNFNQCRCP